MPAGSRRQSPQGCGPHDGDGKGRDGDDSPDGDKGRNELGQKSKKEKKPKKKSGRRRRRDPAYASRVTDPSGSRKSSSFTSFSHTLDNQAKASSGRSGGNNRLTDSQPSIPAALGLWELRAWGRLGEAVTPGFSSFPALLILLGYGFCRALRKLLHRLVIHAR